jgi:hypothetical protein
MTNRELFKEAIADAKAVKDAAIANAKVALEEAFTPILKEKLAQKIQEMEDDDSEEETYAKESLKLDEFEGEDDNYPNYPGGDEDEPVDEQHRNPRVSTGYKNPGVEDDYTDDTIDELNLDELLAELELEEEMEEEEPIYEAKEKEEEEEEEEEEYEDKDADGIEDSDDEEIDITNEEELIKIIDDEVNNILQKMIEKGEIQPGPDYSGSEGNEEMPGTEMEIGAEEETMDEDFNIDELLYELKKKVIKKKDEMKKKESKDDEKEKMKKELKEAIAVINTLRREINETKLLNAKLLYTNKIFKARSLNESQKVKVLATFDKAGTVKEVELVYETLNNSFSSAKKQIVKESLGFASKPTGVSQKRVIVEEDAMVARFKKLAGLI